LKASASAAALLKKLVRSVAVMTARSRRSTRSSSMALTFSRQALIAACACSARAEPSLLAGSCSASNKVMS
jgi:hypothetical protein